VLAAGAKRGCETFGVGPLGDRGEMESSVFDGGGINGRFFVDEFFGGWRVIGHYVGLGMCAR